MAQYTLIARINAGGGKFPFVNVRFSKNHRPIPIEGATYYLRPSTSGKRTPFKIGKDVTIAHTALIRMEDGQPLERNAALHAAPTSSIAAAPRRRVADAAREYIERSKQKSRRTYWVIASPSTCSSPVVRRLISTRFAATTCSTFCTTCGLVHPERPASQSASQPCSTISSRQWSSSTTVASGSTWQGKIGCRKKTGLSTWTSATRTRNMRPTRAPGRCHDPGRRQHRGSARSLSRRDRPPHRRSSGRRVDGHQWEDKTISVRFKPKFGFKPKTMKSGPSQSVIHCSPVSRSIAATRRMTH